MSNKPPTQAFGPIINRIPDVMSHTTRYAFLGVSRLAADAKVSPSSVSRLINGKINPSFALVARLTDALERRLGRSIDPRDLIAELGRFRTPYTCDLVGCRGCLPAAALDEDGYTIPEFEDIEPGKWVSARFPKGYSSKKGDQ